MSPRAQAPIVPTDAAVDAGAEMARVLFEDDDLLAVDKPAGMVVHPAYRHPDGTLFDALVARQAARGEGRPWLLHRLDRDTSGVVLLAKSERARRGLVRQFERRQVRKWYLALVRGTPGAAVGEIRERLRRDPLDRRRVVVDPAGQEAITRYQLVAAADGLALLLVEPRTGRTHQIRAHLAWLGHPIAGDATYGGEAAPYASDSLPPPAGAHLGAEEPEHGRGKAHCGAAAPEQARAGLKSAAPSCAGSEVSAAVSLAARQMLHAWMVHVCHPVSGDPLWIQAPVPADMAALLPAHGSCAPALPRLDLPPGVQPYISTAQAPRLSGSDGLVDASADSGGGSRATLAH